MYLDLDRFKVVNDSCGHQAGDHVLAQAAAAIGDALGPAHALFRFHGDEFVAILHEPNSARAAAIAETVRVSLEGLRFCWGDVPFALSASIGVVPLAADATPGELLGRALSVCELAKEQGRNRVLLHASDDGELRAHRDRLGQRTRIQRALEEHRLVLYGQRIEPLRGGAPHHVEVLARIMEDTGALVPPGAFIPAAERYGLMPSVDRYVISRAFEALSTCAPRDRPLLSINLSGLSLADDAFAGFVGAQFRAHRIGHDEVCFEITETAAISNIRQAERFIETFRERGCRFSLDDFGSGMSSFSYLKRLKVDFLKIDGLFVRQVVDDRFDQAMVRAVQSVAAATGLQTIAEYVESAEIAAWLRGVGVNYAQGYGVHRPEPLGEVLRCVPAARLW
jgi:diguanylate cyclase (GGDEF)-like protein